MATEHTSAGGVRKVYGPYSVDRKLPSAESTKGEVHELQCVFDYSDLPDNSSDATNLKIPANAFILSAHLVAQAAFATLTALVVGLQQADGTEIDNDGLLTSTNGAVANINGIGKWVVGSGALVGATIGAAAGQISVSTTGSAPTAGRAKLVVRYLLPS